MGIVVAVDGPAGSGKGTVTKRIEKELGLMNLDTGATYRCVALAALRKGYSPEDEENIIKLLDDINIEIENGEDKDIIILNGEDVSKKIRKDDVKKMTSIISGIIPVRQKMTELQRKMTIGKNVIVEGRDIGTVVFPNADLKIYLDASEEVRAERRYKENIEKGMNVTYEEVLEQVRWRDNNDRNKKVGALKKADDAIVIDSSNMTIDEVVNEIKNEILKIQNK